MVQTSILSRRNQELEVHGNLERDQFIEMMPEIGHRSKHQLKQVNLKTYLKISMSDTTRISRESEQITLSLRTKKKSEDYGIGDLLVQARLIKLGNNLEVILLCSSKLRISGGTHMTNSSMSYWMI